MGVGIIGHSNNQLSFYHSYQKAQAEFFHGVELVYEPINQSNFYSANMPGKARLSGTTAK